MAPFHQDFNTLLAYKPQFRLLIILNNGISHSLQVTGTQLYLALPHMGSL